MKHNTYNLLVWKWIDEKFDNKWMYLLCLIFVDIAFLLMCMADLETIRNKGLSQKRINAFVKPENKNKQYSCLRWKRTQYSDELFNI